MDDKKKEEKEKGREEERKPDFPMQMLLVVLAPYARLNHPVESGLVSNHRNASVIQS